MSQFFALPFGPQFFRASAACAFITAITTLFIHLLPGLWSGLMSFDERVLLYQWPSYQAYHVIVLGHCLLVVASTFAIAAANLRRAPALMSLGFLGYLMFSACELLRTSMSMIAVNRYWRPQYVAATDPAVRQALRENIEAFTAVGSALFFLFIIGFFLGNLLYGLAFVRGEGLDRFVGGVLLVWCVLSLPGIIETASSLHLTASLGWVGPVYQPLARLLLAIWLWREGYRRFAGSQPI